MSTSTPSRTLAVGVVIPVHDEEELFGAALDAQFAAFEQLSNARMLRLLVLVFDDCRDDSAAIARGRMSRTPMPRSPDVAVMTCQARNVGVARGLGCANILEHWRDVDPARIWIATTDADSRVPGRWLVEQVRQHDRGADVWAGRVSLSDTQPRDDTSAWQRRYDAERQPIHGANLGVSGAAYLAVGGFAPLATGEDRALFRAVTRSGAKPYFDSSQLVVTSSRRRGRAPHGFAESLHEGSVVLVAD